MIYEVEEYRNLPLLEIPGELGMLVYGIFGDLRNVLLGAYEGKFEEFGDFKRKEILTKISVFFHLCERIKMFMARRTILERMRRETKDIQEATNEINQTLVEMQLFLEESEKKKKIKDAEKAAQAMERRALQDYPN